MAGLPLHPDVALTDCTAVIGGTISDTTFDVRPSSPLILSVKLVMPTTSLCVMARLVLVIAPLVSFSMLFGIVCTFASPYTATSEMVLSSKLPKSPTLPVMFSGRDSSDSPSVMIQSPRVTLSSLKSIDGISTVRDSVDVTVWSSSGSFASPVLVPVKLNVTRSPA